MEVSWNNVVSPQRNEIVFSGRNHAYGAYVLRTNYTRTVSMVIAGVLVAVALAWAIKFFYDRKGPEEDLANVNMDVTQIDLTPPPIDKTEPPPPPPPPPPVVETIKFVPPVIKEDAVEDEPPPPQEKLVETQVSTETQEGTGGDDIIVPTENTGPVEEKPAEIFTVVEEMPGFPGGMGELMKYIQKNIQYPQVEKEADIQGTVYVKFVVEPSGDISNVEIAKGVRGGPGLDKEALRVVKNMPKWSVGKQNGRPVRVLMNLPIKFQLR